MQMKIGIQRGTYNHDDGGMTYRTLMVVDTQEEADFHLGRIQKRMAELFALYKEYAKYNSGLEASMITPLVDDQAAELEAVGNKPKFDHVLAAVEGQKAAERVHLPRIQAWQESRNAVMDKFRPLITAARNECNRLIAEWLDERNLAAWERKHITHYAYYTLSDADPLYTWRTVEVPYAVGDEDTLAILGG